MKYKTPKMDMLQGPLTCNLLRFTLPIALSSIVQQLFSAADTAIVGRFTDANALAAVGTNTEIVALIVTVSAGLAVGANVGVARCIGRRETDRLPTATKTALWLGLLFGLLGMGIGQLAAAPLLGLIRTPASIFSAARLYLRLYLLGYPCLLVYDFGAAVLRAQGNSRDPFLALLLSGLANVGLNLFFVLVLRLGVAGVALATDLSNLPSALLVLRRLGKEGLLASTGPRFSPAFAGEILKTGLPSAVQGAVFCFANLFVQASVNRFGETAIASSTIAMHFEYFTYYIITAFGQTATTFTGQNYSAGQYRRCRQILWRTLALSTVCSTVPILTIVLCRRGLAGLFSADPAVIACACQRILCILLFEPVCNLYEIPAGALRGSGHPVYPAAATMIGTCAFRILWICTVFPAHPTLPVLYRAFPLSWLATILLVVPGGLLLTRRQNRKRSL